MFKKKGEDDKKNGWDLGDIAPGDDREEGGKCLGKNSVKGLLHYLSTEKFL